LKAQRHAENGGHDGMETQVEDVELARSAVASTGEIVASKWTPLLIHELGGGTRRFRELERVCKGMSTRTLADRLRSLEQVGVVARHSYPESPPRVEYQLTEKGRALLPIIREMRKFGTTWLVPGAERTTARRTGTR
jgi:DNA-binding HxlR family transcriptional regulator